MRKTPLTLLLVLACSGASNEQPATDGTADGADGTAANGADGTDGAVDTSDSGEPITWQPIANTCTGSGPDGEDPFTLVGSVKNTESGGPSWFTEILDITLLEEQDRVVTAGQGGVVVFDITDPSDPLTRGYIGADPGPFERYYHVRPIEDGLAYATHRDVGLDVLDLTDADSLARGPRVAAKGYEGLARVGDWLYVASTEGRLDVFDVSRPASPSLEREQGGFGLPWDVVAGEGVLYVADARQGLVTLDLSDPAAPTPIDTDESAGLPIRLLVDGQVLYLVSGAGGLEIFDVSTPTDPTLLTRLDPGGGAQDVAVSDGLVAVTTQEAVVLYDIGRNGSPAAPLPFAYEETEQFAMTLDATGSRFAVGDWNIMGLWDAGADTAPAADLSVDILPFLDGGETLRFEITNRGGRDLDLYGIETPEGVTAEVSTLSVAPGERGLVAVTWDGTGNLDGQDLCIATDDPSRPTLKVMLTTGGEGVGRIIGQTAPEFALQSLDGTTYRLSEQLGHPVVLAYFATW